MSSTNLARPSDATGAFIITVPANTLGLAGTKFAIKTFRASFEATTKVADVTGDGDLQPEFVHNGFKNVAARIVGAMIEELAVGLEDIVTAASNPVLAATFYLGPDARKILFDKFLVEEININYQYQAPIVGVSILGRSTNQSSAYE